MRPFAERPLLGWPGITMRLALDGGKFVVSCTHDATGSAKFLYDGTNFGDAADAYKHPFVTNYEEVSELTESLLLTSV